MSKHLELLKPILAEVIAPQAQLVDAKAAFPKKAMQALADVGLLGLLSSADVGGLGEGPRAAVEVIEAIAQHCATTAMVTTMHYSAAAVIEAHGTLAERKKTASGEHLSTLAFSEAGSRSHFWAPVSTAKRVEGGIALDAQKSWITSNNHAATYVWSSRPVDSQEASTIWLVPRQTKNIKPADSFDGLGLRGNDSGPCQSDNAIIPEENRLGEDGAGFGIMMEIVLPYFSVMNAACSLGLMEGATQRACAHASGARYAHIDKSLADLPTIRNYLARMRCKTDMARTLLYDTVSAMEAEREDTMLRVLESKAACNEAATEVTDLAMRVCGGAAFRRDVGVERYFRDARAGTVMAPTTDVLYDFIGKAICGMELF
jgi:alkylation response protein AidB-like acyl-CoA dehydrogenase